MAWRKDKIGKHNNVSLSDEKYEDILMKVRTAKAKETGKIPADYKLLQRYDIVKVQNVEKLIKPITDNDTVLYFVKFSELFDKLYEAHMEIGHKKRDAMLQHLKPKYAKKRNDQRKLINETKNKTKRNETNKRNETIQR